MNKYRVPLPRVSHIQVISFAEYLHLRMSVKKHKILSRSNSKAIIFLMRSIWWRVIATLVKNTR